MDAWKAAGFLTVLCLGAFSLEGCKPAPPPTGQTPPASQAAAANTGCPEPAGGWKAAPTYGPEPVGADKCFFYTAAWQNFLAAAQPDASGEPDFIHFPNIASVFGGRAAARTFKNLKPDAFGVAVRDVERPNSFPDHASRLVTVGEGVRQAGGLFGLVVDGAGHPIFYSIHVNEAYAGFIKANDLTSKAVVEKNQMLEFPPGVAEYKAAWAETPADDPANANFIIAKVNIPVLQQDADGIMRLTGKSRPATLKLIGFHVAFLIKDHPEFVWATFEHQDGPDATDLAPAAATSDPSSAIVVRPGVRYILFATGAGRDSANTPCPGAGQGNCDPSTGHPVFDPASQTFMSDGKPQQTSVFREFPGSRSTTDVEDDAVRSINLSLRAVLAPADGPIDRRANYRLVGATWLVHPRTTPDRGGDFVLNRRFTNAGQAVRVVAGEDALSNMSMESFTQRDSPNCFSCHDTKAIRSDETGNPVILKPTLLNVSHVISRYLSNTH